jgi:hypothetical protein
MYAYLDAAIAEATPAARREILRDLLAYVVELVERVEAQPDH